VPASPRRPQLDPRSLRLFASVIELGTIAAAAEREHIASSALSKRISDLEHVLGTPLVIRGNRGITATPAGQILLGLAHRVLNDFETIFERMREYARGTQGHVRVYANISAITQFLPEELRSFMARLPGVQIHLEDEVSSNIAQAVRDNAADVGILVLGDAAPDLEFLPYRRDRLALIAANGHALARRRAVRFAETLDFDYVGLHATSHTNIQLLNAASSMQRPLRSPVQVKSYDALCLMVEAGLGLGVLPRKIGESYGRALKIKLIGLDEPWVDRTLAVCVRSYAGLPPAARSLVDHLMRSTNPRP
jgi:DNA-binding transcriptional LysR family regulator